MGSKSSTQYRMSFSTGGLCISDSIQLARLYLDLADWDSVSDLANSRGVLGYRTQSSTKRLVRELIVRLRQLSQNELEILIEGTRQEQGLILWLAVCRTYPFIAQFTIEVLQEHFLSYRMDVSHADFDRFFESKSEWQRSLSKISPSTRAKLRQVLFRMMREADILSEQGALMPPYLPPEFIAGIALNDPKSLVYFPGQNSLSGAN